MKQTAKNVADYVHKALDRTRSNNISIHCKLRPEVLEALRTNPKYGFSKVERSFFGYVDFERVTK